MKDFKNKFNLDSDSDDSSKISEGTWKEVLLCGSRSSQKFCKLYRENKNLSEMDRLDKTAVQMGWKLSSTDDIEIDIDTVTPNIKNFSMAALSEPIYSLQNTPECIAATALFGYAQEIYYKLVKNPKCARFVKIDQLVDGLDFFNEAKRNLLLGIEAIDSFQYGLSICLMKEAISNLNKFLPLIDAVFFEKTDNDFFKYDENDGEIFQMAIDSKREIRASVFDLRDIALRIIRDAQIEFERIENDDEEDL